MNANSSATNNKTVSSWLEVNTRRLSDARIDSARLDCLLLLEHVLHTSKAHLLAHTDRKLSDTENTELETLIQKRIQHVPLAYLRGYTEFYGRSFIISEDVLVPRPETEAMIDLLKRLSQPSTIIDVGTGSGALAISAQLAVPSATVYALDISSACLKIAQKNAVAHAAPIIFLTSNVLDAIQSDISKPLVILANLPYVPDTHPVNEAAQYEPSLALYGGTDGLDLYRTLWQQISDKGLKPTTVLCESLVSQHANLATIAQFHGYNLSRTEGLQQQFQTAS